MVDHEGGGPGHESSDAAYGSSDGKVSGYEPRDVHVSVVLSAGGGLAVICLVSLVAMAGFLSTLSSAANSGQRPPSALRTESANSGHHLEEVPGENRLISARHGEERIGRYAFIDERAGRVRIPIERAMALVVERGLPHRAPGGEKP